MSFRLRRSTPADTENLGRIHAQAWQESYAGIVPDSVLGDPDLPQKRIEKRRGIFAATGPQHGHFLIEDDKGRVVGFGDCGPALETGDYAPAEVTMLYLLREAQGKGMGQKLLLVMLKHLADQGFPSAALKVFTVSRVRSFYEKLGGQKVAEMDVTMQGQKFSTTVYVWSDLKPFASVQENLG